MFPMLFDCLCVQGGVPATCPTSSLDTWQGTSVRHHVVETPWTHDDVDGDDDDNDDGYGYVMVMMVWFPDIKQEPGSPPGSEEAR